MEQVLTITGKHFCAGAVMNGITCIDAAPIIHYMIGWRLDKIRGYCFRRGWTIMYQWKDDSSRPDVAEDKSCK